MASLKAMKPVGTKPVEPVKKEPAAKSSSSAPKIPASKPAPKKAEQKPREPKKKVCKTFLTSCRCLIIRLKIWLCFFLKKLQINASCIFTALDRHTERVHNYQLVTLMHCKVVINISYKMVSTYSPWNCQSRALSNWGILLVHYRRRHPEPVNQQLNVDKKNK